MEMPLPNGQIVPSATSLDTSTLNNGETNAFQAGMHTAEINAPTVEFSQILFAATPLVLVDAMADILAFLKRTAKRHVASAKKWKPEMKKDMKGMGHKHISKIFRFIVYFLSII